jgi:hypothetical protein
MLDREWAEGAAKAGALPAVAAALQQVSRSRPPPEIVARLTPGELEWGTGIVGRWPDRFPPGVLAPLKGCTLTPQRPMSHQRAARTSVESQRGHGARKRAGRPFEHPRSATAAAKPTVTGNSGIRPRTTRRKQKRVKKGLEEVALRPKARARSLLRTSSLVSIAPASSAGANSSTACMPSGLSFILSPSSNWQFWTPSQAG